MKTITLLKTTFVLSLILCLGQILWAQSPTLNFSISKTDATCSNNGKITITIIGTPAGTPMFTLKESGVPQGPNQTLLVFDYLSEGNYTVEGFDNNSAGVPTVRGPIHVDDLYTPMSVTLASGTVNEAEYCLHNGVLSLAWSGGRQPFKITYTNTTAVPATPVVVTGNTTGSFTANNLKKGTYSYIIEDACGNTRNGSGVVISDNGRLTTFADNALTGIVAGRTHAKGIIGDCNKIKVIFDGNDIFYQTQQNPTGYSWLNVSEAIRNNTLVAAEYPAGATPNSGTVTAFAPYVAPYWITINNFTGHTSPGQHTNKVRFVVKDPCAPTKIYYSSAVSLPYDYAFFLTTTNVPKVDYCTPNPAIEIKLNDVEHSMDFITSFACKAPYTAQLWEKGTGPGGTNKAIGSAKSLVLSGSNYSAVWEAFSGDAIIQGNTYYAVVNGTGWTQTTSDIVALARPPFTPWHAWSGWTTWGLPTDSWNFHQCDFNTAILTTSVSLAFQNQCTKYTIRDLAPGSTFTPRTETICNTSTLTLSKELWTDLPWGNYEVEIEYYCGPGNNVPYTQILPFNLIKPADDFYADVSYTNASTCGLYNINAVGGFTLNGAMSQPWGARQYYWRAVVTDCPNPAQIGYSTYYYGSSPITILSNMPPGKYEVVVFPCDAALNPATGIPVNMSCAKTFNFDIPVYTPPVVDNLRSGGYACDGVSATLYITLKHGNPLTCQYQMRSFTPPATYGTWTAPQSSNMFTGIVPGMYEIFVSDGCATTTSFLRVYNQGDQVIEIIGELEPHKLCETMSVTLSPGTIGPATSYLWEFSKSNSPYKWSTLTTAPTYFIEQPTMADLGYYQVTIDNGTCNIVSEVYFNDVLPASPRPVITGAQAKCPGDPLVLTVTTNPPMTTGVYHWYKDDTYIETVNVNTYIVYDTGEYRVVTEPNSECPSWPSIIHHLEYVDPPNSSILSADVICPGINPVIRINPSLTGVTYKVFAASTNGSSLGEAVGTGGAIQITVNDNPSSPKTYYIEASIAGGTCPPSARTPLNMTFGTTPDAPTHTIECNTTPIGTAKITVTYPTGSGYTYSLNGSAFQPSNIFPTVANGTNCTITVKNANGCTTTGISFNIGYNCGITLRGTVFPFVNRGESDVFSADFNSEFSITVKLKAVPTFASKPTEAQLVTFLNGAELYSTTAVPYTGAKFVPNTPEHPGTLGEFTNYGELINFGPIGKTHVPGSPKMLLSGETPFTVEGATVGLYEFTNVTSGEYILEISRAGYMVRWAKITVNNTDVVQNLKHREILPGYVITNDAPTYLKIFTNDAAELARLIENGIYYKSPGYDPKYDLNADGYIDAYDYYLLQKYINFMHEHYEDTWDWINGY